MKYYLSFDVKTTSMKCILYGERLNKAFFTAEEYSIIAESGGIAEALAGKPNDPFIVNFVSLHITPYVMHMLKNYKNVKYPTIF